MIEGLLLGFLAGAASVGLIFNRAAFSWEVRAAILARDTHLGWKAARQLMTKQLDYEPEHADEVIAAWRQNAPWMDEFYARLEQ